jgi:formylglycine-generating enzyme required for sulfatase activity
VKRYLALIFALCLLTGCGTSAGDTWTRPTDGAVMVYVPAGEFLMGSLDDDPEALDDEKPQNALYLDAFWIDKTKVTNAQYHMCVDDGACEEPVCWEQDHFDAPDQPVVCVSWFDAQDFAAWAGGRLPTEAEWEKAARGTVGRKYPWGNSEPDCRKANYGLECVGEPSAVGSYPGGASPYGALDMAGNVWEWVADRYGEDYYSHSEANNPQGPVSGEFRVLRGGAFYIMERFVRCAFRGRDGPDSWTNFVGFRVVVAPGPSGP